MKIRFYIDPETGSVDVLIFTTHDVRENEVEDVLQKPGEDRPGKENSRMVIEQMRGGRYLQVIYVPDHEPNSVFVITAYELVGKLLKAYQRRQRR